MPIQSLEVLGGAVVLVFILWTSVLIKTRRDKEKQRASLIQALRRYEHE